MRTLNGLPLTPDHQVVLDENVSQIIRLCDAYRALNDVRIDLDGCLMKLPEDDDRRDILWDELEAVLKQLSDLARELAATSLTQPFVLRAKGAVLALMLRAKDSDLSVIVPEATALALSLADGVVGLTD